MKTSDIWKLLAALALVAAVALAAYLWIRSEGNLSQKYSHPISRQGAKW